jgi:hypothetical protein
MVLVDEGSIVKETIRGPTIIKKFTIMKISTIMKKYDMSTD